MLLLFCLFSQWNEMNVCSCVCIYFSMKQYIIYDIWKFFFAVGRLIHNKQFKISQKNKTKKNTQRKWKVRVFEIEKKREKQRKTIQEKSEYIRPFSSLVFIVFSVRSTSSLAFLFKFVVGIESSECAKRPKFMKNNKKKQPEKLIQTMNLHICYNK